VHRCASSWAVWDLVTLVSPASLEGAGTRHFQGAAGRFRVVTCEKIKKYLQLVLGNFCADTHEAVVLKRHPLVSPGQGSGDTWARDSGEESPASFRIRGASTNRTKAFCFGS
jgi:hypothetical protein